ncbi:putative phosphoesterase [Clostridium tetanomorphum]|uniref:Phosphoesterase n=1 Tax=Clostridium tetanomorphum TaxID=1553 RepID=A0A923E9N6_CLOTT|nr:metallophosphoesterase family protein [Clostridium tetanomorphum]KAJ51772.1 Ser/Thr protein phosphatase [Clostridium tetanomorphum DSM 665]MBC2397654.1 metallophosphoesterase family protein [Clostridium tetanomorphum]MBP1865007.1 putative phosphoesterase [Clostridium tetanomorphum]NRS83396.1 putative phosphoesterase [Clostridium tetanomorphum]NRZ96595.1 putative phosphoesterase [Clostridium tetanomorphum]
MKIAVISDIHGNIFALDNVLCDIDKKSVDCIINLGDFVGYGSFPNEVIERIRKKNILSIKGNYDASVIDNKFSYIRDTEINKFSLPYAVSAIRKENMEYLKTLPNELTLKFEDKTIIFVHGSPESINEYLKEDSNEVKEVMKKFKGDILVCAHTHIPYMKKYGEKIIINDGSVGKPKIGRPNSTYVILNIEKNKEIKAEFIEISYNYKKIIEDMQIKKFPEDLIKSYETGKE